MEDTVELLQKIRDHYLDIKMLTMHCCSEISPDAIPDMVEQRAHLLELIAGEERRIPDSTTNANNSDAAQALREEIRSIVQTIIILDKQVETVIGNHLTRIKSDLSKLYKTSRAASAYTIHSRV
jgi:hypothetical protein